MIHALNVFNLIAGKEDDYRVSENSTADYIWTLYDNRDIKAWVREKPDSGLGTRDSALRTEV